MLFNPQHATKRQALTRPTMKYKTTAQRSFYPPWYLNMGLLNYFFKQILQLHISRWFPSIFQTSEVFWSAVTLPAKILCLFIVFYRRQFWGGPLKLCIAKKEIHRRWKLKNIKSTFFVPICRGFFRIKILNFWAEMYCETCFIEECCQTVFKYNFFPTFFLNCN